MALQAIDWSMIVGFFVIYLLVGIFAARKAGGSSAEFFLSGRNMPWWLLGVSMVATTFSTDTPNLVTDIVRQNGVAGNWVWWAFLLTGMLTVFVYAKLWRRSGVLTDLEFYELRYSGKSAAFLRGFRAVYLGILFNMLVTAGVCLAMIKIGGVMLNLSPVNTLLIASLVTVVYSALGGLRGVIIADFLQFGVAMVGSVAAAVYALNLPEVGGMDGLLAQPALQGKLNFLPDFNNWDALLSLLILPLAVQWWSVWYPGSEPGGGGYVAQRILSAKNERHAMGATLLFNAAHYALRPWPWILVALCSLVVFPDLASLQQAFPHVDPSVVRHDLAYPAMLTFLPAGLLGVVLASLIAAFMSTVSTQLNWGASYIVNDVYKRFFQPDASEKQLVNVGRLSTVVLMVGIGIFALLLSNAMQAFNIILQIGAGTGLLFILRWFWWRINAWSEIAAMVISFLVAVYLEILQPRLGFEPLSTTWSLLSGVGITTIGWLLVTLLTKPTDDAKLASFYRLVQPGGPGWQPLLDRLGASAAELTDGEGAWDVPAGILAMVLGCLAIYGALFATGYWLYGQYLPAIILTGVAGLCTFAVLRLWNRLQTRTAAA